MIKSISHNKLSIQTSPATAAAQTLPARPGSVVLLLLDGWGVAPASEANAISGAKMPYFLKLIKEYPVAVLATGAKSLNLRYLILGAGQDLTEDDQPVITLTKILADASLKQLKLTEAERLAALTNFFNGRAEQPTLGEDWQIIAGLSDGQFQPAAQLAFFSRALVKAIKKGRHDFIVSAMPALDLAAASGEEAAKQTAGLLDKFLKKIIAVALEHQGVVLISSAHGNAEKIRDLLTDLPDKTMTDNPVPLIIIGEQFKGKVIGRHDSVSNDLSLLAPAGNLADVAPTILQIMNLTPPAEMTGRNLIDFPLL